ncbi:MAG: hypothetical protein GF313_06490 [Caldithrix sp.]|nr:hypothetical protein [Caldithrix sp.]
MPRRLHQLFERLTDRQRLLNTMYQASIHDNGQILTDILTRELYKDNLSHRQKRFRDRLYDRTVHPTQMLALDVDAQWHQIRDRFFNTDPITDREINALARALIDEYLGTNVAINSAEESQELLTDLTALIDAEESGRWIYNNTQETFLSFWGDWDGSTRPSGQGHRLVASVVIENIKHLSTILTHLNEREPQAGIEAELLQEIAVFQKRLPQYWRLLNKITNLTNQLEQRYRRLLPSNVPQSRWRRWATRLGLLKDPLTRLYQHNDRMERRMLALRQQRKQGLQYYFTLNKKLRKTLYPLIPVIHKHLHDPSFFLKAALYRSRLRRFVLTPRIHQGLLTDRDPFAIDTTVYNITELNAVSGAYGNPGVVLALQVSMATDANALISLSGKFRTQKRHFKRSGSADTLPQIWAIPLFEDETSVQNLPRYLDQLWQFAAHNRPVHQTTAEMFGQYFCEVFIAGSDLSQQVGQPASLLHYRMAKQAAIQWLAQHHVLHHIRIKLGSGEPMQRQGGYFDARAGQAAFLSGNQVYERLSRHVQPAARQSAAYARSPLRGILAGGDLRTFQSNVAEHLRTLESTELAQVLHHVYRQQQTYENALIQASEPLADTRLQFRDRGMKELQALTSGTYDSYYETFTQLVTRYFRHILYGTDDDIFGIHIYTYFISRAIPPLRDRPTVRPGGEGPKDVGHQVMDRIARTLPLSRYGSMLRAIGHNRAQTMILGINQLTTGLFLAMKAFLHDGDSTEDRLLLLTERILAQLPVYDILHTYRLYTNRNGDFLKTLETIFPAGNSVFAILNEDMQAADRFIPLLQQELLRRHGLATSDFFDGKDFKPQLLPTLRPDLAVLLQNDLLNTDSHLVLDSLDGKIDREWREQLTALIRQPATIQSLREKIWTVMGTTIKDQVRHFVELAQALQMLNRAQEKSPADIRSPNISPKISRLRRNIKRTLSISEDDSMIRFLQAAAEYVGRLPHTDELVPIDLLRILNDIQRIARIEEQMFSKREQDVLRFHLLHMARLCGENG